MPDLLERLKSALADRYAVESEIGRGGMATVFLAEDLKHHRKVAIKVLHPELAASLGTDRFLREIKIAAGLDHPHILPLHDSGEADGLLFYVMPYVEGESLGERLEREGQLPLEQALDIAGEVADALAYAHRQGVVHRDIKPGNVLLAEGHARIADFGVARAVGVASEGDTTATGLAVGTPKYMSPEQAAGGEVDGRSDVYALGCVVYEMLAGDPPFDGPTPQAILTRKAVETVPGLRIRRRTVPADLEAVIGRAMATAPVDRFETADEFARALKAPAGSTAIRRRRPRVSRFLVVAGATILLLIAGMWLSRPAPTGDEPAGVASVDLDPDAIAVLPFEYIGSDDELRTLALGIPNLFRWKVTGAFGPSTADRSIVWDSWEAAGGSVDTPITEEQALEIGEAAGAGLLVEGMVTGTKATVSLTARMLEVPSGRVRVRAVTREGPYENRWVMVDELINELLSTDYGSWTTADMAMLSTRNPDAVQAYLADDLETAFALDSTFYLAGYLTYRDGENDHELASYLWDHRDEMSPIDQAELKALAGWRFGATRTLAERFAQWDSASKMPGWEESLSDLVWQLWASGSLVDVFRHKDRAEASSLRWRQRGRATPLLYSRLADIAAVEGDTAALRLYAEEVGPRAKSRGDSVFAAVVRLRVALLLGDTAQTEHLWEEVDSLAVGGRIDPDPLLVLLVDGRGLEGLDRFMLSEHQVHERNFRSGIFWARARGRYSDWRASRDFTYDYFEPYVPLISAVLPIRDVLFLGEPEDSSVLASVSRLDSIAEGLITVPFEEGDPTPEVRGPALARCWGTLWRVSHGDMESARETVRHLREDLPLPYRYSVCAGLIEVLVAEQEGGDLRAAVARLDSIVRPVPMETGNWWLTRDGTHWIDNLFLSQKLLQVGDTATALAASRRAKPWNSWLPAATGGIFVDLLREEARLSAMVGDTAGAIDAYEHWLTLRDTRPESPHWGAQWDSVRAEYTSLTGRESP